MIPFHTPITFFPNFFSNDLKIKFLFHSNHWNSFLPHLNSFSLYLFNCYVKTIPNSFLSLFSTLTNIDTSDNIVIHAEIKELKDWFDGERIFLSSDYFLLKMKLFPRIADTPFFQKYFSLLLHTFYIYCIFFISVERWRVLMILSVSNSYLIVNRFQFRDQQKKFSIMRRKVLAISVKWSNCQKMRATALAFPNICVHSMLKIWT